VSPRRPDVDMSAHSKFLRAGSAQAVAELMNYEFILHSSFGIISSFVIRHTSFFR